MSETVKNARLIFSQPKAASSSKPEILCLNDIKQRKTTNLYSLRADTIVPQ